MQIIKAKVAGTTISFEQACPVTTNMVGVKVEFSFDPMWEGLNKTAVFKAGSVAMDAAIVDGVANVPPEVLVAPVALHIGVYGSRDDGTVVIPTVMARSCFICTGAKPSGNTSNDTPDPNWEDLQNQIGNLNDLNTEAKGNLVEAINEVLGNSGSSSSGGSLSVDTNGDATISGASFVVNENGDATF